MPKAILTVGVSGSGKTTWAMGQNVPVISRDDVRRSIATSEMGLLHGQNLWSIWKFGKIEKRVTQICDDMMQACIDKKQDFIIADTNLNPATRGRFLNWLLGEGYTVSTQDFNVDFDVAVKRDKQRIDSVGFHVIYQQWQAWQQYLREHGEKRVYVPDASKPSAVIFDIDGTLAHMTGRGPFDWHRVQEDKVDEVVRSMLWGFQEADMHIVVMSGRDSVCREATSRWLDRNLIYTYGGLHMRAQGDMRKDSIIKEELFWEHVAPRYNVEAVIDDRPQVCRMWYDLGIPKVVHVGNPWIEF